MNTKLMTLSRTDVELKDKLQPAADVIKSGGLVVFPTETVYGLGADATNAKAAEKIFYAKGRPSDNPLIIHIAKPEDAEKYTYTNALYYKIAEKYMPGPITVILPAKNNIPLTTRAGLSTVAVRCPSDNIASALIELSGVPIAAPSANLSGSPSPTSPQHVIDDMMGRVDIIIDGGVCDFGLESTIVKIEDDETLTLLRPGRITVDELENISHVNIAPAVVDKLAEGERAISPGMKYRHYAPKAPLVLIDGDVKSVAEFINSEKIKKIAVIAYEDDIASFASILPDAYFYSFGAREEQIEQAHRLFSILRDADKRNFDKIYAPLPSKNGVGLALYNRMIRAAAHTIVKI